MPKVIGVRELRQSASEHLRAVAGGEEIVITDRGRPVARLVSSSPAERRMAELVHSQALIPPSRPRRRFTESTRLTGGPLSTLLDGDRQERPVFGT